MGNESNIVYALLPASFKHFIISSKYNDEDHFEAAIRLKVNSKENFLSWLREFEQISNTKWVVHKTYPKVQRLVYRADFICQHGPPRPGAAYKGVKYTKKIECKAKLIFKLNIITKSTLRKNSFLRDDLQGLVIIRNYHNHTTKNAIALSLLRPNNNCKQQFESYFSNGLNVIDAMKFHADKLRILKDFSEAMLANGSINPKYRTVRWWYQRWKLKNSGPSTGSELLELLEKKIHIYKESGINIILHRDPLVIIIITPIMRRANLMKEAGEIIFIDSTSSCNSKNHSLTFLMMPIAAGAIPLCLIITSGQTSAEYELALNLFNTATEGQNFGGNGYPEIILSDYSNAKHRAIINIFPNSILKPCIFHVQQTIWRWLWEDKHCIALNERQTLMHDFQILVKCLNEITVTETYNKYMDSILWNKYPKWIIFMNSYWAKRHLWCRAYRDNRFENNDVNNFCEANIRLFKDIVYMRSKSYNVISLIDFICTVMEDNYRYQLRNLTFSGNKKAQLLLENLFIKSYLHELDIVKVDEFIYIIQPNENDDDSDNNYYLVNLEIGTCTCDAALKGRFCRHQASVWKYTEIVYPSISTNDCDKMEQLALGDKLEDIKLYDTSIYQSEYADNVYNSVNKNNFFDSFEIISNRNHEISEDGLTKINFNCIIEKLRQLDEHYSSSNIGLNKIFNRLQTINNKTQWYTFLHKLSVDEEISYRPSSDIFIKKSVLDTSHQNFTCFSKKLPTPKVPIVNSKK